MAELCEHGIVESLMGGRLSCKACADSLSSDVQDIITAIELGDLDSLNRVLTALKDLFDES